MNIGTAKPQTDTLIKVLHYFINSHSIHETYDVRRYEKEVLELLEQKFPAYNPIILTGGSGLYIDAVVDGLDDMPEIDPKWREELNEQYREKGLEALQEQLQSLDAVYYATVDLQNPQRIIRALEVCLGTGIPFSSFRRKKTAARPFRILKIALTRERDELYERINQRMDQMISEGLFVEAEALYPFRHLNALHTVGYTEIFGYLDGLYDREEAIRLLKRNSRRYAKRQLTWLRKDPDYHWFHPDQLDEIVSFILNQMDR